MQEYLKKIYQGSELEFYNLLQKDLKNNSKRFIITVNPETVMLAKKDLLMSEILLNKNVVLVPDGIGVVKACRKLELPVKERITGIDISQYLLKELNVQKKSIYLFGAKEEVVSKLVENIKNDYPNIVIKGYSNGYVKNRDLVFKKIIKLEPDVCLVALGVGEQEKIIYKYLNKFSKGIFIGVGGSFDVLSGYKKRAPKIFIKCNLEWFYRIIKEPARLKRFWKNNVKFVWQIKK